MRKLTAREIAFLYDVPPWMVDTQIARSRSELWRWRLRWMWHPQRFTRRRLKVLRECRRLRERHAALLIELQRMAHEWDDFAGGSIAPSGGGPAAALGAEQLRHALNKHFDDDF